MEFRSGLRVQPDPWQMVDGEDVRQDGRKKVSELDSEVKRVSAALARRLARAVGAYTASGQDLCSEVTLQCASSRASAGDYVAWPEPGELPQVRQAAEK